MHHYKLKKEMIFMINILLFITNPVHLLIGLVIFIAISYVVENIF